ncbi:unnamed protein product, partial [Discosporangium mesarthrocarpum]
QAFSELLDNDGLVVMARGLGVRRLLAKFLVMHCMHGNLPPARSQSGPAPSDDPLEPPRGGNGKHEAAERRKTGGRAASNSDRGFDGQEDKEVGGSTGPGFGTGSREGGGEGTSRAPMASPPGSTGEGFDPNLNHNPNPIEAGLGGGGGAMIQEDIDSKNTGVRDGGGEAPRREPDDFGRRSLVLCLNAGGEEDLFLDALMSDGVPPNRLPEVLDAEFTPVQRQHMYQAGGVFLVTSRVLIVDLLNKVVDPLRISGFLVHRAHRVLETSSEAFILRVFREGNRVGFVKAFSDQPEAFLSGFAKLGKVLRNLHVSKVYLWPRFHALVAEGLEKDPPVVEELVQGLTPAMKEVQQILVVLMDQTLRELKAAAPALDTSDFKVESCIFTSFDKSLKRQLEPEWHQVTRKVKQLLADLKTLRTLLDYLFRYDSVTFYQLLQMERAKAAHERDPPLWLGTTAADRLFRCSKSRVFRVVKGGGDDNCHRGKVRGRGGKAKLKGKANGKTLVAEENPKWSLAADVLGEIRELWRAEADGGPGGEEGEGEEVSGGARVMLLVQDEHTCSQLREHSALGGRLMMKRRFLE